MMRKQLVFLTTLVLLSGCSMGHRDPVEIKAALDTAAGDLRLLPSSVSADLKPISSGSHSYTSSEFQSKSLRDSKRLQVNASGVEAKAFFSSLFKDSDYNLIMDPKVDGSITLSLKDVTVGEALKVISDIYGYKIVLSGKIVEIYPAELRVETIPVDYLAFKRNGKSNTTVNTGSGVDSSSYSDSSSSTTNNSTSSSGSSSSSGSGSGSTSIDTSSESDFWSDLEKTIIAMIGSDSGKSVTVSSQASVITVKAFPNDIRQVRNYIAMAERRLKRQVILEVKILEVTLSDGYQQGVNWSKLGVSIGNFTANVAQTTAGLANTALQTLPAVAADIALPTLGSQGISGNGLAINFGNGTDFAGVMSFLGTQGDLNVLSSPRLTAINNQKAVIKVGEDKYYVTGLTSNTPDTLNPTTSDNVDLSPFFSGISLDVTPQIDDNGRVLLHVHPAIVDVQQNDVTYTANGKQSSLPTASSTVRESDSVIEAKSGDVVVIGGLMQSNNINDTTKVPLLGDIPGIGNLFRSTSKVQKKTELIILLKPTVVTGNTWSNEIQRSRQLMNKWFPDQAKNYY